MRIWLHELCSDHPYLRHPLQQLCVHQVLPSLHALSLTVLPLSMYVSLEMTYLWQAYFITQVSKTSSSFSSLTLSLSLSLCLSLSVSLSLSLVSGSRTSSCTMRSQIHRRRLTLLECVQTLDKSDSLTILPSLSHPSRFSMSSLTRQGP
jgi:hypothetical protein